MKVLVHGRNVEITEWMEEYVAKKVKRLERYVPNLDEVRCEVSESATRAAADRFTVQITIWANGQILRAEETSQDIFASIDAAADKISRQIQRYKERTTDRHRRTTSSVTHQSDRIATAVQQEELEEATEGSIVRRKQFQMHPLSEEEAIEQMELLGHDFFLFYNPETRSTNVIYRRKDGDYGLLQPQMA